MFLSQSNGENYDRSLRSLEPRFDSDDDESQKFYRFDFLTISIATDGFSQANKIWQGESDSMYKGRLQNGQGIAIMQPCLSSQLSHEEYINNVLLLGRVENQNLVQLLGYCLEGTTIFLVYGFELYTNLDHFLSGKNPLMEAHFNWNKRYEVILGVANALVYLHNHAPIRVIHADVRPQNLHFNKSLDHKLSFLGSARHSPINETDCVNVDRMNVTTGYMAPEYMIEGCLSTKADVFGFGLIVLENVSGQRNYLPFPETNENFVQYVWANWLGGTFSNIISDPRIDADSSSISRFINIGLLCVQANADDRPTMDEVVGMLLDRWSNTLPLPKNPVSSWMIEEDSDHKNVVSDDYDSRAAGEFLAELSPR
ncbi:hypothetical protein L1887_02734 [Cichorium endivia]|nr:hypothetical protein L1887_02734 [Cichorium endivia]